MQLEGHGPLSGYRCSSLYTLTRTVLIQWSLSSCAHKVSTARGEPSRDANFALFHPHKSTNEVILSHDHTSGSSRYRELVMIDVNDLLGLSKLDSHISIQVGYSMYSRTAFNSAARNLRSLSHRTRRIHTSIRVFTDTPETASTSESKLDGNVSDFKARGERH